MKYKNICNVLIFFSLKFSFPLYISFLLQAVAKKKEMKRFRLYTAGKRLPVGFCLFCLHKERFNGMKTHKPCVYCVQDAKSQTTVLDTRLTQSFDVNKIWKSCTKMRMRVQIKYMVCMRFGFPQYEKKKPKFIEWIEWPFKIRLIAKQCYNGPEDKVQIVVNLFSLLIKKKKKEFSYWHTFWHRPKTKQNSRLFPLCAGEYSNFSSRRGKIWKTKSFRLEPSERLKRNIKQPNQIQR